MNTMLVIVCVLGGGAGVGLLVIALLYFCWGRGGEHDQQGSEVSAWVGNGGRDDDSCCAPGCAYPAIADEWNDGSDCD